jgi:hypothetical protein
MFDQFQQRVKEASNVQQSNRLGVQAQLRPGDDFINKASSLYTDSLQAVH